MAHKLIGFVIIIGFVCVNYLATGEDAEGFVCQEDVKYELEETFPCECLPNSNNTLACDCPEDLYKKQDCQIGAMWMKKCNTCWCRIVGVVCEKHECLYIKLNNTYSRK